MATKIITDEMIHAAAKATSDGYDLIGSIVPAIMATVDGKQHPAEARIVATPDHRFIRLHPVTVDGRPVHVHNVYAEYAVSTVRRLLAAGKPIAL